MTAGAATEVAGTDQRDREVVVRATIDLLEAGEPDPAPEDVARRAGLPTRTVVEHFEDLEGLFLEAIRQRSQDTFDLYLPPSPGRTTPERVALVVAQRCRLHEGVAPTRRFAASKEREVAALLGIFGEVRVSMRRQLADHFAQELAAAGDGAGELLDALDLALSWESWDYLRSRVGATPVQAEAALARTVGALLGP